MESDDISEQSDTLSAQQSVDNHVVHELQQVLMSASYAMITREIH